MKRRIISALLALVMVMTLINAGGAQKAEAADGKVLAEELAGYKRVTLNDFMWANGGQVAIPTDDTGFAGYRISAAYLGNTAVEAADSYSLDHTYLDFDIKTGTTNGQELRLFNQQTWHHYIRVKWFNDGDVLSFYYFNDQTADETTKSPNLFLSQFGRNSADDYFNIKIRADFTANASDPTKRDAVLQFWVNNIFAHEMHLEATDLRNGMFSNGASSSSTYYVKDPTVTLDNAVEGGFDTWTFRDANLGDQTITGNINFNYTRPKAGTASMNGALFRGKVNFSSAGWNDIPMLYLGGSPSSSSKINCGFRFRGSADNLAFDFTDDSGTQLYASSIYASTAGTTLSGNSDLEVALSVNILDSSDGKATAAIGLFFDGKLYNNKYFIWSGLPEEVLTRHIKIQGSGSRDLTIYSYPAVQFTEWTFRDLGIEDQTLSADASFNGRPTPENAASLDKTFFQGLIDFPTGTNNASGEFFVSGSKDSSNTLYAGLFFRDNWTEDGLILRYRRSEGGDPVTVATFTSANAGTGLRNNPKLRLGLSVEKLGEADSSGFVNTRLGVFFDGVLYEGMYITASLPEDILNQDIKWSSPRAGARITSYPVQKRYLKNELDGYERINLFDYECTGARVIDPATGVMAFTSSDEARALINEIDHAYLDVDVNFPETQGNYFRFFGEARAKNIFSLFVKNSGTLGLQYLNESSQNVNITEFDISDFDIVWGEYFNVKFRIDTAAASSAQDDISVQLWLNDIFAYEGEVSFTYSTQVHSRQMMYTSSYNSSGIPNYIRADIDPDVQLSGYKKVVPDDFDQLSAARSAEGTYNNSARAGVYCGDSLDRTYFNADIKAEGSGQPLLAWLSKAETNRDFYGDGEQLVFYIDGTVLKMQEIHGGRGTNTETVTVGDISAAPYNYSPDAFFNLKLRTRIYDSGIVGLLVYINDSLLNCVYVSAATKTLTNDQAKFTALYSAEALADMTWAGLRGTVSSPVYTRAAIENEQLKDAKYDLSKGVYLLTGAPSFRVNGEVRNPGDVISEPGEYMIERIIDGRTASTQKVTLTESGSTGTLTYEYLGGSSVMPIAGFYGPSSNTKTTEDVYRLISESGINLINYLPPAWYEGSEAVLRNLDLAEKYGIGIYVSDPALNTVERDSEGQVTSHSYLSSAADLAQAMESYSAYSSFLGIHVFDEPKPDDDASNVYSAAGNYARFQYYRGILEALQPYTNVTGYINLHGAGTFRTDADFRNYLSAAVGSVDVLSFDTYPYLDSEYSGPRMRDYLDSLDTMATFSRTYNKPFWSHVQAGTDYRDNGADSATSQYYTEADTLWIVNTSLAFGAKGIAWFPMMQPEFFSYDSTAENGHDYDRNGLIGADNKANRYYDMVKRANTQIAAADEVLMNAQLKGVVADGQAAADINYAATTGKKHSYQNILSKSEGKYTDALTSVATGAADGTMIGCFDYQDTEAYWVVNYSRAEDSTQRITLNFDGSYELRVIRNGQSSDSEAVSKLNLYLDSGEAALVVLGDKVPDWPENVDLYMGAEIGSAITAVLYAEVNETTASSFDEFIVRAQIGSGEEKDLTAQSSVNGRLRFDFTDIYSQQMTEEISAALIGIKAGAETQIVSIANPISIADYCDQLAALDPSDTVLLTLMANMLKFGEECQKYTGYRTNEDQLPMYRRAWAAESLTSEAPVSGILASSERDGSHPERIKSAGLSIANRIMVYFKVLAEDTEGLTLSVSGDGISFAETAVSDLEKQGGLYRAELSRFSPSAYDTDITATLKKNGTVIHTVHYSVNKYCSNKAGNSALRDIVYAIYNYGTAAEAYNNR